MKVDNRNPYYGVDAPGIIKTLLLSASALIATGFAVSQLSLQPFWLSGVGWFLVALGVLALVPGITMLRYAGVGKFVIRDRMLSAIRWRGDERVLDVGTGRGLIVVGAAKRLKTGKAVGIDIWNSGDLSGNSSAGALVNAEIEGVSDRVQIATGDARKLDFRDCEFDAVFSLLCVHNIEDAPGRDRACREIARVIKPGGTVVIGDYVPTKSYATALAAAGLVAIKTKTAFFAARGPMWITTATKPYAT